MHPVSQPRQLEQIEMTLTIRQISKYLGLNEFTTYRLVKSGKLSARKNDGKWVVEKKTIDNLFERAMDDYKTDKTG